MNQWELKTNTQNQRQARENACDQVTIGFGFQSDWVSRWRKFFKPIIDRGMVKKNQSDPGSLSTLNWKPVYVILAMKFSSDFADILYYFSYKQCRGCFIVDERLTICCFVLVAQYIIPQWGITTSICWKRLGPRGNRWVLVTSKGICISSMGYYWSPLQPLFGS